MKFFVVTLSLLTVVAAAPLYSDAELAARRKLPALEHEEIHDEYGQFALRYVTAEGTVVSERGRLVPNANSTGFIMILEGEYSYIGDDGQIYVTKYSAGPDGNHVEGNHFPVSVTAKPLLVDTERTEVAAEHVHVIAKPIENDAIPVDVHAKPIHVATELVEVAESSKVVAEPTKVVVEPIEAAAKSDRVVPEPVKVLVEPIEAAAESVAETGRVIVQPIEFIIEPFISERLH